MKKKIKDLTLGEAAKIMDNSCPIFIPRDCEGCPLNIESECYIDIRERFEKEIEVDEE